MKCMTHISLGTTSQCISAQNYSTGNFGGIPLYLCVLKLSINTKKSSGTFIPEQVAALKLKTAFSIELLNKRKT